MKTTRKMFVAFLLNTFFSIFEFFGGILSGSFAIMSDALHDFGDAVSIGVSLVFEKKSKKAPDETYTFGYGNYSLIGALFTTVILLIGSSLIIVNAACRIIEPQKIEYGKMIVFAVVGVVVNTLAAVVTRGKESANQRAVNLHMLEDVLGWICVLTSAVVMHFTDFYILDSLMSIAVSVFLMFHCLENLKEIFVVFLCKAPQGINIHEIKKHLSDIDGINSVHHLHIWKHGSGNVIATVHIVSDGPSSQIKKEVRKKLLEHGINHVTMELEKTNEDCENAVCPISYKSESTHCHAHHH